MNIERPSATTATAPTATAPTLLEDVRAYNASFDSAEEVQDRLEAFVRRKLHIEDDADVFLSSGHTTAQVHVEVYFDGHLVLVENVDFEEDVPVPIDFSAQGDIDLTGGDDDIFGRPEDYADGEDFDFPDDGDMSPGEIIARSRGYVPAEEYIAKSAERSSAIAPSLGGVVA
jgi:hypothetical protein